MKAYYSFKPYIKNNQAGKDLEAEVDDYIKMTQHCIYHQELHEIDPLSKYERRKDQHKYFINEQDYVLLENLGKGIKSVRRVICR